LVANRNNFQGIIANVFDMVVCWDGGRRPE